jgi:hypothetical protein
MSVRMLAIELYRVMTEVKELEKKIGSLDPGAPEREKLKEMLRVAQNEERRIRTMLEGAKAK